MPSNEGFGKNGPEAGLVMKKNLAPVALMADAETDAAAEDLGAQMKKLTSIDA